MILASAVGLVQAPPAAAAGLVPTGTTVTVSPLTSNFGDTVHISATVKILGVLPGLGITPKGTVTFKSTSPSSHSLGTATLGSCFLTACTASINTSDLPAGNIVIVKASYSGDTLMAPSSGTKNAKVLFSVTDEESCATGPCSASAETPDNADEVVLDTESNGGPHTLHLTLDTADSAPCQTNEAYSGAAEADFYVSPDDVNQTVTYYVDAPQGQIVANHYNSHPHYLVCFAAPMSFYGFTNGVGGDSPFYPYGEGGEYRAFLPNCNDLDGGTPCFLFENHLNGVEDSYVKVTVFIGPYDPKIWI